jgi:ArsR family transcriptional regulator
VTPLVRILRALSDETRLRIINLLAESGELCVCDIEAVIDCPQAKVSRHLAYLRRSGLVEGRKQGLWMIYCLAVPKSPEHEAILKCMRTLLPNNTIGRQDKSELQRNVKKGCCAVVNLEMSKPLSIVNIKRRIQA